MRALRTAGFGVAVVVGLMALWVCCASLAFLAGTGLWGHPGIPRYTYPWQWLIYTQDFGRNALTTLWLLAGGLVGAMPVPPLARLATGVRKKQTLFGESKWMTREEAEASGLIFTRKPLPDAIVLGTYGSWPNRFYVSLPGEEHAALYAKTRGGKGVGFVMPNALNFGGSLLVFSVKRDVVRQTAARRAAMGDDVYLFDITAPDGHTHRWNPLGNVRRGTADAFDDVQRVMFGLIPPTKANNPYFDNAGRRIATAVGVLFSETPGAELTVAAIRRAIARPDFDEVLRKMIRDARVAGHPHPAAAVDTVIGWLDRKDDQGARDVQETIKTALALWELPRIAAATAASDFDLAQLRSKRMTIYVCAEPADIRRLRLIYAQFFQQLVELNTRQEFKEDPTHQHRAMIEFDEFWALGKQDILADASAFIASFGIRVAYIIQSKQQTIAAFGKEGSENLFLNTGAELALAGLDLTMAKEFSEIGGTDTVTTTTENRPRFMAWLNWSRQSQSESLQKRHLILPQEVMQLGEREMLVKRKGRLLKLERIIHYQDPVFGKLTSDQHAPIPDHIPALPVVQELDDAAGALAKEREAAEAARRAIEDRHAQAEAAKREGEGKAAAALAKLEKEAGEVSMLARAAEQVETMAAAEAKAAAVEQATAAEAARQARAESTEANRLLRKATEALDEHTALGVVPPWISTAVPPAQARAAAATTAAKAAAETLAEATEAARVARAESTAAGQAVKKARNRAAALAKLLDNKRGSPS